MPVLTRTLSIGCLALLVAGCGEPADAPGTAASAPETASPPPSASPAAAPPSPVTPSTTTTTPALPGIVSTPGTPGMLTTGTIETASALIDEMVRAYGAAPTFTDRIEVEFRGPGTADRGQECLVRFGHGTDAYVRIPTNEFVALGDWVYVTDSRVREKFVKVPLTGNLLATCREAFGAYKGLGRLVCALRFGEPRGEILAAMGFGLPGEPALTGHRRVVDETGRQLEQILLDSGGTGIIVSVDPETRFVVLAEVQTPVAEGQGRFTMRHVHHPQAHPELPEPIVFDTEGSLPLLRLEDLYEALPGQLAPDFVLPTLEGEQVALVDLRGSVVVLSFWATWSMASRDALPKLQEFARWAEQSEVDVRVLPVNVEREPTPRARWQKARDFWMQEGFTMRSLVDVDGEVPRMYGLPGIPATYIIDPEGRVFAFHTGVDEDLVSSLRREVTSVLEQAGAGRP